MFSSQENTKCIPNMLVKILKPNVITNDYNLCVKNCLKNTKTTFKIIIFAPFFNTIKYT
jgi:hypothetical protein